MNSSIPHQTANQRNGSHTIVLAMLLTLMICARSSAQTLVPMQNETPMQKAVPLSKALGDLIKSSSGPVDKLASSIQELRHAERLFVRTLRAASEPSTTAKLQSDWAALAMEMLVVEDPRRTNQPIWIIKEDEKSRRGRGIYVIRAAAVDRGHNESISRIVLQMPHSFHDRHTREIGIQLCAAQPITAAAWNTVHRKTIDLAHAKHHYLNAFTAAIVTELPSVTILQPHGFSQDKRSSNSARTADCIVSNGSKMPSPRLYRLTSDLNRMWPQFTTRLYPTETRELGATSNQQAHLAQAIASARFLHLEMSAELRQRLRDDHQLATDFFKPIMASCRR